MKKSKKILFLVRSSPPYMSNRIDVDYIIEDLIEKGYNVDIYDTRERLFLNCNNKTSDKLLKIPAFLDKFPFYLIINFFFFFFFLRKIKANRYDLCHIFYIREEQLLLYKLIRKKFSTLILTVYGSDYNLKNFIKNNLKTLYTVSDKITATNESLLDKIHSDNQKLNLKSKMEVLMFPQIRFKKYFEFDISSKNKYKEKLGFLKYKKVVIVGTSAADYENHFEIINQIAEIPNKNILFVFPLTYGTGDYLNYRRKVKKEIENKITLNSYLVLFDYMDEESLSDLRKSSDILINLRQNDQFVFSMLESFLSGCEVITGSWLPYDILNKSNIDFFQIESIKKLTSKLEEVLAFDFSSRKANLVSNQVIISNKYNIEKDLKSWRLLYDKNIKK